MQSEKNLTPLMKQYWDIKSLHEDKILLFRMGDFYEMFHDDAVKAAPILGIALTSRNKKSNDETPMCGVPHHSIAGPINKLLAHGLKVALCDQIEDPKFAKGIVKRAVTRILSPGMVYDPETLDGTLANYIACFEESVFAAVDVTTGEAFYFQNLQEDMATRLMQVLPIVEMLSGEQNIKIEGFEGLITYAPESDLESGQDLPKACLRILKYVTSQNPDQILTFKPFERRSLAARMMISQASYQHLEIFQSNKAEAQGSLFHAINKTKTSAGARLLRSRLSLPLVTEAEIATRHDEVSEWFSDLPRCQKVREILAHMGDIERRLGKISQTNCHARDLLSLAHSTRAGIQALALKSESDTQALQRLSEKLIASIHEDAPLSTKQGHMIQKGVSGDLDELIELSTNSSGLILEMEQREREKTGINSLKIRYNNVFGYYIEITNTHKEKAPSHYMRKQTLSTAERFYTDELMELEKKVLSAQTRRFDLEYEIFEELRKEVLKNASALLSLAQATAELDVMTSAAWLAAEKKYVRPKMNVQNLRLLSSRHPVVEQFTKNFIPNTIQIESGGCLLLTGPNMAGKSTIMRQVALISILAQIGFFVPALEAELPIFESLYTRIGASDQLSEGLSTFMVEMQETSEMLKRANSKSLLILDEVGRGTSTFDGMSLAQAILEHIVKSVRSVTLFATHYHEMTGLEFEYPQVKNGHMTVSEKNGEIQFLHTLVRGPAQKSYGIQVAKLAGVPQVVTKRAEVLLKQHEVQKNNQQLSLSEFQEINVDENKVQQLESLIAELQSIQIMNLTPLQVMERVQTLQSKLQ